MNQGHPLYWNQIEEVLEEYEGTLCAKGHCKGGDAEREALKELRKRLKKSCFEE